MHLKKINIGECVAILILKMEENTQHFWHIMLYYFKKCKTETKMPKKFVQCMEKVLWYIEHVKSGLWNSVLEISHWMMLKLSKSIKLLKNVSFILQKKPYVLFSQPSSMVEVEEMANGQYQCLCPQLLRHWKDIPYALTIVVFSW